jgi:hypothetical protein
MAPKASLPRAEAIELARELGIELHNFVWHDGEDLPSTDVLPADQKFGGGLPFDAVEEGGVERCWKSAFPRPFNSGDRE